MSFYSNTVISQVPVNFRHANALRRVSLTRASEPGDQHDVEAGDEQQKRVTPSNSAPSREPYDCISNPAPWYHQITFRALLTGAVMGTIFSIIVHKLNLTTGIVPSLNIAAGLLGFIFLQGWTWSLKAFGISPHEFTPQENTVVQTCVVACYSMAYAGGFGCYLLSMDHQTFSNLGPVAGNRPEDVYEPVMQRIIPYMFCIGLIGIFMLVIMRKKFIIDYRLHFPSGTATGILISGFHTPKGQFTAKEQVKTMGYWGMTSFLWSFFEWFFSGAPGASNCGFRQFPSLGLSALAQTWSFDFSLTYVGVGMIVPYVVAYSLMFGAILSHGIMWPLISKHEGEWYPAGESSQNFKGLFGYKNFIAIALFIGDGLYNFLKIGILSLQVYRDERKLEKLTSKSAKSKSVGNPNPANGLGCCQVGSTSSGAPRLERTSVSLVSEDPLSQSHSLPGMSLQQDGVVAWSEVERIQRLQDDVFLKGCIPRWVAVTGCVVFSALAVVVIPLLYPPVRWYYVLVLALITPFFAVANAYGTGLTDFDMSSVYGTVAIFVFAVWGGTSNGGVIAGLAVAGFVMAATSSAGTLMQDFKTGHITMSSPRSMFIAQICGAVMGCFIAPLTFQLYWHSFPIGDPSSEYKAPFANIYRGMAVIGTQGFSMLPKHCGEMMIGFLLLALVMSLVRDLVPERFSIIIPMPMAMAIPFFLGANVAVDIFVGAIVKVYWYWTAPEIAPQKVPAAASGLIAGDGMWTIPSCILSVAHVNPPLCMSFASSAVAAAAPAAG